jgi:hypothetical protein
MSWNSSGCACRHVELDSSKTTCYITKCYAVINVVMLEKHGGPSDVDILFLFSSQCFLTHTHIPLLCPRCVLIPHLALVLLL